MAVHIAGFAVSLSGLSTACDSNVVIGRWSCENVFASSGRTPDALERSRSSFGVPWSTGFEEGLCEYADVGGYCYAQGLASYRLVNSPVHSGRRAAAFTVIADGTLLNDEARCIREGNLPEAAYYGAWYLVPSVSTNIANWNLFHFQGGNSSTDAFHGIWDVSLAARQEGGLGLTVYDFLGGGPPRDTSGPPIPVGSWFHLEVYFKRAADYSGEFTVYQDGVSVWHVTGRATDDSVWGQWYLGNLAVQLEPLVSTVYVDDITVRAAR